MKFTKKEVDVMRLALRNLKEKADSNGDFLTVRERQELIPIKEKFYKELFDKVEQLEFAYVDTGDTYDYST